MDFIIDPSLALYLPLYQLEGASLASRDAYGHLATVTGAAWRPDGRYFDGVDDRIDCGNSSALRVATGTILAWFKADTIIANHHIAGTPYDDGAVWNAPWAGFSIWQNSDTIVLNFNIGGTYKDLASNAGEVAVGQWYLGGVTWDGSTGRIFKNGVEIKSSATLGSGDITYGSPVPSFIVGVRSKGTIGECFAGSIGEVFCYNRALNSLEIEQNYLATKWRYR